MGQALPNPELQAEHALHYEIAWRGQPIERLTMRASLFLSRIDDTIQRVDRVAVDEDGSPLFQLQNVGGSEHRGVELAGSYAFGEGLNLGANYTYLERENLTNPLVRLTDTPGHKLFAFVEARPTAALTLLGSVEYNSSRFSTSYGVEAGSFTLSNLKANYDLPRGLSLSVGVNNLFDRNYALTEGCPEEGRNFFATLNHRF
ncbi:MAG: TonB-dependent receptor domain-containing protein [Opitutaceae bacterium]